MLKITNNRLFSTTAATTMTTVLQSTKNRRTVYNLKPVLADGVTQDEVTVIIQEIIRNTPTSFNMQNIRAAIFYGDSNKKLWSDVYDAVADLPFAARPKSLRDTSYGTIVFFEDKNVIAGLAEKFAAYKDMFPVWAAHSNGSAQIAIWKALSDLGFGATLQHFNTFVTKALGDKVGKNYEVVAQLAFGVPTEKPLEKQFTDYEIPVYK